MAGGSKLTPVQSHGQVCILTLLTGVEHMNSTRKKAGVTEAGQGVREGESHDRNI